MTMTDDPIDASGRSEGKPVPTPPRSDPHRPPSRRAVLVFVAVFVLGLLLQASVLFADRTLVVDTVVDTTAGTPDAWLGDTGATEHRPGR